MADLYSILSDDREARRLPSPQTAAASEQPLSEPPRKRPRVNQACETCRERKTRCGGERPICLACERRGVGHSCSYDRNAGLKRKTVSLAGPALLEHLQQSTPKPADTQPSPQTAPAGFAPINRTRSVEESPIQAPRPSMSLAERPAQDAAEINQTRDSNGVYGPSSTIAFLNTISDEPVNVNEPQPQILGQRKTPSSRGTFRPPEKMFVLDRSEAVLPRRREADDFIRCYWEYIHPLFPVLHKQSFMHQYEALWSVDYQEQSEFDENMFLSALNVVFAIGCKFSHLISNEHKTSLADEFYQRSRKMFCYDVLDTATLSMVQLLVLIVVYLQSTHHAVRCWNAIGLAVRASQSIGIHLDYPGSDRSQLHTEMRRRIWYTCVSLDRLVAMVFGRPTALQKTPLPLPAMIDDEYLGEETPGVQPQDQLPQLGLFIHSCQLLDILEDVLSTFYTGRGIDTAEKHANDMVTSVMHFTGRIDGIVANLPKWLVEPDPNADGHVRLQQRVLHNRILYVRLLAMRPLLILATQRNLISRKTTNPETLEDEFIRSCCIRCLATAQHLIDNTYDHLTELYRSSSWHATYFTCAALMVLLAAMKSAAVAWDDAELHSSWDKAIAILEYYQEQVPSAAEGISILQSLKRQLIANRKSRRERTGQPGHAPTPASTEPSEEKDMVELNFGFDDLTDAWFSQYFFDANWMDVPAL